MKINFFLVKVFRRKWTRQWEPKTKTKEIFRENTKPSNQPCPGSAGLVQVLVLPGRPPPEWNGMEKKRWKFFKKVQKMLKNIRKIVSIKFCENYFFLLTMPNLSFSIFLNTRKKTNISLIYPKHYCLKHIPNI